MAIAGLQWLGSKVGVDVLGDKNKGEDRGTGGGGGGVFDRWGQACFGGKNQDEIPKDDWGYTYDKAAGRWVPTGSAPPEAIEEHKQRVANPTDVHGKPLYQQDVGAPPPPPPPSAAQQQQQALPGSIGQRYVASSCFSGAGAGPPPPAPAPAASAAPLPPGPPLPTGLSAAQFGGPPAAMQSPCTSSPLVPGAPPSTPYDSRPQYPVPGYAPPPAPGGYSSQPQQAAQHPAYPGMAPPPGPPPPQRHPGEFAEVPLS